jgi:hypothetical protein
MVVIPCCQRQLLWPATQTRSVRRDTVRETVLPRKPKSTERFLASLGMTTREGAALGMTRLRYTAFAAKRLRRRRHTATGRARFCHLTATARLILLFGGKLGIYGAVQRSAGVHGLFVSGDVRAVLERHSNVIQAF